MTNTKTRFKEESQSTVFTKHHDIFKGDSITTLKTQMYDLCIHPAMAYSMETWTLANQTKNKLAAAQTETERSTRYVKHHILGHQTSG